MNHTETWAFIKEYTKDAGPGCKFDTTLLGFVRGVRRNGELVGTIPYDLQTEAQRNGFRITHANIIDSTYTLEKLNMSIDFEIAQLENDRNELFARIERLEAERDSFYMDYRMKCDVQTKALVTERDALLTLVERLQGALKECKNLNNMDRPISCAETVDEALGWNEMMLASIRTR